MLISSTDIMGRIALVAALSGMATNAWSSLVEAQQEECRRISAVDQDYCLRQKNGSPEACRQEAQAVQTRCYTRITEHDAAYEREKRKRMQEEEQAARERMLKAREKTGAQQ